jgi:ABC-type polysaccharide/polyol phosphate export permease
MLSGRRRRSDAAADDLLSGAWVDNVAPARGFPRLKLGEPWAHRELIYFFALRDVKVRYKQAFLGAGWAILQPLVGAAAFTVIFGELAGLTVDDEGSYFVFALVGFVLWSYFSTALANGSNALVANADLLTKVAIPRVTLPAAALIPGLVDLAVGVVLAFVVTVVVTGGLSPVGLLVSLPAGTALLVLGVVGPVLFLSALIVRYRDVGVMVSFGLQVLLFVSPVAYPPEIVPEGWRVVQYANPLTGALALYRNAFGGTALPHVGLILVSSMSALLLAVGGLWHFRSNERQFVDII